MGPQGSDEKVVKISRLTCSCRSPAAPGQPVDYTYTVLLEPLFFKKFPHNPLQKNTSCFSVTKPNFKSFCRSWSQSEAVVVKILILKFFFIQGVFKGPKIILGLWNFCSCSKTRRILIFFWKHCKKIFRYFKSEKILFRRGIYFRRPLYVRFEAHQLIHTWSPAVLVVARLVQLAQRLQVVPR